MRELGRHTTPRARLGRRKRVRTRPVRGADLRLSSRSQAPEAPNPSAPLVEP